ncbi:cytochrome P450 [Nocardia crassostreae]|uniref:cytochrome P450 n=1 Tax=Nocardia crassostreae TaxID=53428 RepID=UPI00083140A5|nr:cytochrome P450 [Nocardia crassostreae]
MAVILHGLHHHHGVWERPEEFDPSRFLPENLEREQRRAAIPFGAGKRMCVASGFASMEATLVVATFAQHLLFDAVSPERVRRQISFTGGPDGPLPMRPHFLPDPHAAGAAVSSVTVRPPIDLRPHRRRSGGQRWHEHNSARRTTILEAAVALLEEQPPGAEISTAQIADRAGLARSVIYRQFENREHLDAHVREFILHRYLEEFEESLVLDPVKTVEQIVLDIMRTVVRYATEHPHLYRFVQLGPLPGAEAATDTVATFRQHIADTLWQRFTSWTRMLGIDVAPFRPLAYGLVGLVEGIVTQYLSRPADSVAERPEPETIARLLTSSTWYLFDGHARELGYAFDRATPVSTILGALFEAAGRAEASPTGGSE